MTPNDKAIGTDLAKLLTQTAQDAGKELKTTAAELAEYVAERISHLRFASKEPGFADALIAERDSIVLMAADKAVEEGDATDARLTGLVEGALTVALRIV